jgi:para-aminobenzoate synthetase / 4-amino-4-deoxychorismate lyase
LIQVLLSGFDAGTPDLVACAKRPQPKALQPALLHGIGPKDRLEARAASSACDHFAFRPKTLIRLFTGYELRPARDLRPMIVLDFQSTGRRVFDSPVAVLRADALSEVTGVIEEAERAARGGSFAVGYVSYEAAPAFDAALRVRPGRRMPLAWFGIFDDYATAAPAPVTQPPELTWSLPDAGRYMQAVEHIREQIAAGRTYQVNLTDSLSAAFDGDAFAFYESLRRAQGSGYHAFFELPDFTIASASPELFFDVRGRRVRTRPMKGTRPRGRYPAEDEVLARELAASDKDRAENLMIVDLLRNDLGRVAAMGSVEVKSLYAIERYRTVLQMTSVIEATLAANASLLDVFAALFPCGSVTGAPKVSTMELISELETTPREVYCGAIGVIEPGGDATFAVPIRTVWIDRTERRAVYGTGAGITFDSNAHAEYAEVVAKAAVLTEAWPDFELLETMRLEDGVVVRLERHLARLMESARYFGIPVQETRLRSVLSNLPKTGRARIRLLVDGQGEERVESHALEETTRRAVSIARTPVDSSDRFLFHKTTHRAVYDRHISEAWDVLLWNERGEVTEFTRGNVVLELSGELVTPARDCGLLAGCFRAELLEAGRLREAVIALEAVASATRLWLINSVREWVAVDIMPQSIPRRL